MNVVCIGAGYVGTVTGAAFAAVGHPTTVIDTDRNKVELLLSGKSPIYEPGLDDLLLWLTACQGFRASTSYAAVGDADAVFIGVGTPSREDGTADLRYVKSAAELIGRHLSPDRFTVIVNKSTVPVGTADLVAGIVEEASGLQAERNFSVVSNPEFLREGYALEDVFFPERIIVGTVNEKARQIMRNLYRPIVEKAEYEPILRICPPLSLRRAETVYFETNPSSAELIKYASNAFLAVKISYINEIARLSEALGVGVMDVAKGIGLDSRIGPKFLQVSSGWSGSCLPKDTAELLATSLQYGCELSIVKAAVESNRGMLAFTVEKLRRRLKTMNGKRIGVLGLTFKPDTDDARETQASYIIRRLIELGCSVSAYDPQGMGMFRRLNADLPVQYCSAGQEVARRADALLLLTHWDEFRTLDWSAMQALMRTPYILDTRNFLNKSELLRSGFQYEGIGDL